MTPAAPEAGGLRLDGASGGGEKREEEVGVRFPYLARAGVEQGGGATAAGSERLWHPRWRRWGAGKGAGGGGGGCGEEERHGGLFIGRIRRWRGAGQVAG